MYLQNGGKLDPSFSNCLIPLLPLWEKALTGPQKNKELLNEMKQKIVLNEILSSVIVTK